MVMQPPEERLLRVRLARSEEHAGQVGGRTVGVLGTSFTRPNNTTAYAIGDLVANSTTAALVTPIVFKNVVRKPGGSGFLHGGLLLTSANKATPGQFDLMLFYVDPGASVGDNVAWDPSDDAMTPIVKFCGVVSFTLGTVAAAAADAAGNMVFQATGQNVPVVAPEGITDLVGYLVARNAYTPVALETFTPALWVEQN